MMKEKETKPLRILAIGESDDIRDLYNKVFQSYARGVSFEIPIESTVCSVMTEAVETVTEAMGGGNPFAVVFIHLSAEEELKTIETTERIRKIDPRVNFVILSESSDDLMKIKERVPPASKLLFVQKPFHPEEIIQFVLVMGALWQSEKELQRTSDEMLDVSRELIETNDALSVLARNLEKSRRESDHRMVQRIRTLIMPVIQKLRYEKGLKRFKPDLDLLSAYIESLTADLASDLKVAAVLSRAELQVASLIKNGMTSEEIATHMNISLFTVKTHRKNIRKKLDIQNSGINLRSFLESGLKEA